MLPKPDGVAIAFRETLLPRASLRLLTHNDAGLYR